MSAATTSGMFGVGEDASIPSSASNHGDVSQSSALGVTQAVPFSSGNPRIDETRGIMHLFHEDGSSTHNLPVFFLHLCFSYLKSIRPADSVHSWKRWGCRFCLCRVGVLFCRWIESLLCACWTFLTTWRMPISAGSVAPSCSTWLRCELWGEDRVFFF